MCLKKYPQDYDNLFVFFQSGVNSAEQFKYKKRFSLKELEEFEMT